MSAYDIWHQPNWQYVLHEGIQKITSPVGQQMFPVGSQVVPDSDGDGLSNVVEAALGTDPNKKDTDGDGIGDYAEVFGWDWVDYPALGANPRRADVFIEVDYVEYTDGAGVLRSWKLSDAVIAKLTALYGGLSNVNPDGSTGITLHIVHDTILPIDAPCHDRPGWLANSAPFNPRYVDGFRYAALCKGIVDGCGPWAAGASLGTRRMFVCGPGFNANPNDDQTEGAQFAMYSRFAHELAHTLTLDHGGVPGQSNWKPNYPSLMNYSYDYDLNGSPGTLQGTQIQFSPGTWPVINEISGVSEVNWAPSGTSPSFLPSYDGRIFPVSGRNVDWNRNGAYSGVVTGIARFGTGVTCVARNPATGVCGECNGLPLDQTCLPLMATPQVLTDVNDAAHMAANLASWISGVADAGEDDGVEEAIAVGRSISGRSRTSAEVLRLLQERSERARLSTQHRDEIRHRRLQTRLSAYLARYNVGELGDGCDKE